MKQQTLTGFEKFGKTTRRAQFLSDMDRILPWPELVAVVDPVYPKVSELGGRPPIPLERMLQIYFLQLWFNLSDPAVEEVLYDSVAMRSFAGIDLGAEAAPDETTVCKFRHLLEKHKLGKRLLVAVNDYLRRNGIKIANCTIVDATIISAPSSTKNKDGQRDPEMHQTAKGQQWYFAMKVHFGVDSKIKLIHTVLASAANLADVEALLYLLHDRETRVWGDQAYTGRTTTIRARAPRTSGRHQPQASRPRLGQRGRQSEEPDQIQGASQSRARDRGDRTDLWVPEGPVPRSGEEPAPSGGDGGADEYLHGPAPLAVGVESVCLWSAGCGKSENKVPYAKRDFASLA